MRRLGCVYIEEKILKRHYTVLIGTSDLVDS